MIFPLAKLPVELRPIIGALWTQPKFFDAIVGQAEALPQSAAQVAATGDYVMTFRWSCFRRIAHLLRR